MIPAIVLYAMMLWQQGQTIDPKKAVCPLAGDCSIVRGETTLPPRGLPAPAPPFDVPPVETEKVEIIPGPDRPCMWNEVGTGNCHDITYQKVKHIGCTDKTRFLLMSEDGLWHCLRLAEKP